MKRPILSSAPGERNLAHCRSSDQKLSTVSAAMPSITQQALQRALNSDAGKR